MKQNGLLSGWIINLKGKCLETAYVMLRQLSFFETSRENYHQIPTIKYHQIATMFKNLLIFAKGFITKWTLPYLKAVTDLLQKN